MPLPPLANPSSPLKRLLGSFKGLLAASVLFPVLLGINVLQTLSLLIKPFSPKAFRLFNRGCAGFWWSFGHLWGERIHKIEIEISGDDVPIEENAFIFSNHQEMPDIPVLFKLAIQKKRIGDLKWFVKDILKYVPGVGWGMLFLDCLFVKRNWTADKDYINRTFSKIIDQKIPVWIISFVEGTRIRPKKLASSNKFAQEKGLKTTQHVLHPRTKGFTATVDALRGHLDAVYDLTIGYVDGVPTISQWFQGYTSKAYLHVRRFPIADLPDTEAELSDWLTERFYIKDQLLDDYYKLGHFPAQSE